MGGNIVPTEDLQNTTTLLPHAVAVETLHRQLSLASSPIRQYRMAAPLATSPDASWWKLWSMLLVLDNILEVTTLYVLTGKIRAAALPESSS